MTTLKAPFGFAQVEPAPTIPEVAPPVSDLTPNVAPTPFWKGVGASFLDTNSTVGVFNHMLDWAMKDGDSSHNDVADENFRAYKYLEDNKKDYADVAQVINDRNLLDSVNNEGSFHEKIAAVRKEQLDQKDVENSSFLARTIGGVIGFASDPVTYIPYGKGAQAIGLVGKIGRLGRVVEGVAQIGGQELLLHQTQELRTPQQSFANVVTGALLMGAIEGAGHMFDKAMEPGSHVNPNSLGDKAVFDLDREHFPALQTENGTVHVQPDTGPTYAAPHEPGGVDGAPSSVGAMATPIEPLGAQTGLIDLVGRPLFKGWTPRSASLRYLCDEAQAVMQHLIDGTGKLTRENLNRVASFRSAESLRDNYIINYSNNVRLYGSDVLKTLRNNMSKQGFDKATAEDFNSATRKALGPGMSKLDRDTLKSSYGDAGAQMIEQEGSKYAKEINRSRDEQVKLAKDKGAQFAQDLGSEYWYQQRYLSDVIMRKQAQFKEILHRAISTDPTQLSDFHHYLMAEHGLTVDQYKALKAGDEVTVKSTIREEHPDHIGQGTKDYWVDREVPEKVDAGALKSEIQTAWAGDHQKVAVEMLEKKHADAVERLKDAKVDLRRATSDLGEVDSRLATLDSSEARKVRDTYYRSIAVAQAERDALEAQQRMLVEAATAARQAGLDDILEPRMRAGARQGPGRPFFEKIHEKGADPRKLAELEGRIAEISKDITRKDADLAKAKALGVKADEALEAVRAKKDAAKVLKESIIEKKAGLKDQANLAGKNVRQLERATTRAKKYKSTDQVIDDITNTLLDKNKLPSASLDMMGAEREITPGVMKERTLRMSPEFRLELEKEGFLDTDLQALIDGSARQIAAKTAEHEAFDIRPEGGVYGFKSFQDVRNYMKNAYLKGIEERAGKADQQAWIAEYERATGHLDLVHNRLFDIGNSGLDKNSLMGFATRMKRKLELLRYIDGLGLANLMDLSTVVLRNKVTRMMPFLKDAVTGLQAAGPDNIKSFISAVDCTRGDVYQMLRETTSASDMAALGFGHGIVKEWSGKFEKLIDQGVGLGGKFSGLTQLIKFSHRLSGQMQVENIVKSVGKYSKLSKIDAAELANLGIGEREAGILNHYIKKYGETDPHTGHFDPSLEKWTAEPGGQTAARDFSMAIMRHMDNSSIRLGIGDLPAWTTTGIGGVITQFLTFNFAQMDRVFQYSAQRMLITHGADMRTFMAMNSLLFLTAAVVAGKDMLKGTDPMARYTPDKLANTALELSDRGGVFGPLTPAVQVAARLGGMQGSSRYAKNNSWTPLAGMALALPGDVGKAITTWSDPNSTSEQRIKATVVLSPYQTARRLIARTGDALEW